MIFFNKEEKKSLLFAMLNELNRVQELLLKEEDAKRREIYSKHFKAISSISKKITET